MLKGNEDSLWTYSSVNELHDELEGYCNLLKDGQPVNKVSLEVLFMATGPLQETSIANGWTEEFIVLAGTFDKIIARL